MEQTVKCAIILGLAEDGSIFAKTEGTEQNLVTIEGLLAYGHRYLDGEWAKATAVSAAQQSAPVESQVEEAEVVEVISPDQKPKRKRGRPRKEA